jgi:hypothetical protein
MEPGSHSYIASMCPPVEHGVPGRGKLCVDSSSVNLIMFPRLFKLGGKLHPTVMQVNLGRTDEGCKQAHNQEELRNKQPREFLYFTTRPPGFCPGALAVQMSIPRPTCRVRECQ